MIIKHLPDLAQPKAEIPVQKYQKQTKPKKNKPMSKTEQERKIAELKKKAEELAGGPVRSDDAGTSRVVPCE